VPSIVLPSIYVTVPVGIPAPAAVIVTVIISGLPAAMVVALSWIWLELEAWVTLRLADLKTKL
jgi:hypothetical protein